MYARLHRVYLPTAGDRISVIPNWGDTRALRPLSKDTQFREKNGISGFVALYTGNLGRSHGIRQMIDAIELARNQRSDVSLVLVGGGAQVTDIAADVRSRRLGDAVRMYPPVDACEYPYVLASADVCLVSMQESTEGLAVPSKLYSYMASGRPIIAMTNENSEVARVVTEHRCGIRVNPNDTEQLATAVLKLHDSQSLAEDMGSNARQALLENYTIEQAANSYYRVFRGAVQSTGGGKGP